MKPIRNFRFQNKKEFFAVVAFKYDHPVSLAYHQYKEKESVAGFVQAMLSDVHGADVISIRRVYLDNDIKTDDPPKEPTLTIPTAEGFLT